MNASKPNNSNYLPRGLRNHNPLNIRRDKDKWQGLADCQTDNSFCQFVSNAYGYRAAFIILRRYINDYGWNTITKIISHWAPPNENHTAIYIRKVAQKSKVPANEVVSFNDCVTMTAIVAAMTIIENGVWEVDLGEIKEGWRMAVAN